MVWATIMNGLRTTRKRQARQEKKQQTISTARPRRKTIAAVPMMISLARNGGRISDKGRRSLVLGSRKRSLCHLTPSHATFHMSMEYVPRCLRVCSGKGISNPALSRRTRVYSATDGSTVLLEAAGAAGSAADAVFESRLKLRESTMETSWEACVAALSPPPYTRSHP